MTDNKNYFYSDPLKAEWMKREFKIKFQFKMYSGTPSESKLLDFSDDINFASTSLEAAQKFNIKYRIHPEYNQLFQPQVGDLIEYTDYKTWFIAAEEKLHHEHDQDGFITLRDCIKWWGADEEPIPIIQRDGKAFFMPEIEEIPK